MKGDQQFVCSCQTNKQTNTFPHYYILTSCQMSHSSILVDKSTKLRKYHNRLPHQKAALSCPTSTQPGTVTHQHTRHNPSPGAFSFFPAGAWLAKCPCASHSTEVTSLPLGWEPWTMWTTEWQNFDISSRESRTTLKLALKEMCLVAAAANTHPTCRYGITQLTNAPESWCTADSMGILSHRVTRNP